MKNSCEQTDSGEDINCKCYDAQRRIDNGQIDCRSDLCPDDCEVCKFCLYYVVDCHSHSPSSKPSSEPSSVPVDPTISPSKSPTIDPTGLPMTTIPSHSVPPTLERKTLDPSATPSSVTIVEPSAAPSLAPFDIGDCASYSNKW